MIQEQLETWLAQMQIALHSPLSGGCGAVHSDVACALRMGD